MTSIFQDIRQAVRQFRRAPTVAGIAIGSIALSVGATAVVFTAIKAVLLDPFPFSHPAVQSCGRFHFAAHHWRDPVAALRRE